MSLIKKIFGADKGASDSTQFRESKSAPGGQSVGRTVSENAPRRDLVQVVLRETMRKHGIPSDWIDCRTLSVLTQATSGSVDGSFPAPGDHIHEHCTSCACHRRRSTRGD